MLRRLGYLPTGRLKVVRSKALIHPFVMIGSKRYPVSIIPDDTLLFDYEPLLVFDAKAPGESIVKSRHVEQAFRSIRRCVVTLMASAMGETSFCMKSSASIRYSRCASLTSTSDGPRSLGR